MVTQFRNTMMRCAASCGLGLAVFVGVFGLLAGRAAAQTVAQTVEARPSTVNVPATRSAPVPVTWELTNNTPDTVFLSANSQGVLLFAPGISSPEFAAPLVHGPIQPGQTVRLRETLVIPHSVLTRVLQAGSRTIGVERFFEIEIATGQFITAEGSFVINLTGSLGGEVQISRLDLRFQNEAVQIIVPQSHPPEVHVDIAYTGTGLFRAVWEIADPRVTAAGGSLIFRILRQERVRLGVGGQTRIKGPSLSADLTGLHVVRFRVLDGPLAGQAPVVRYFVKAASPDGDDWWKRYIRPHSEGEGMVRVPAESDDDEVTVEEPADEGEAGEDGAADEGGGEEPPQE